MKNLFSLGVLGLLLAFFPASVSAHDKEVTFIKVAPSCAAFPEEDRQALFQLFLHFRDTFSAHDFPGHFALYHFPIARISGTKLTSYQTLADVPRDILVRGLPADYARSEWTSLEIIQASKTKVHVIATFDRLRKDGTEIGNYPSLYIVEKIDGKWGFKVRSNFLD